MHTALNEIYLRNERQQFKCKLSCHISVTKTQWATQCKDGIILRLFFLTQYRRVTDRIIFL